MTRYSAHTLCEQVNFVRSVIMSEDKLYVSQRYTHLVVRMLQGAIAATLLLLVVFASPVAITAVAVVAAMCLSALTIAHLARIVPSNQPLY
jgi:hypothetical protein